MAKRVVAVGVVKLASHDIPKGIGKVEVVEFVAVVVAVVEVVIAPKGKAN